MSVSNSRVSLTRCAAVVLALFTVLTLSQATLAQIIVEGGGNQEEAMKAQFRASIVQQEASAKNRIASRIADLDRACQLTDGQKLKLRIASKGAIKETVNQVKKQMAETAKQMNFEFDPDDENGEDEGSDEDQDDEAPNENGIMGGNIFFDIGMMGGGSSNVEDQKIWKNAIKSILTPEQTKSWDAWLAERKSFQQQIAVGHFVARVDRTLLLSGEQREQLTAYLIEEYGEKLQEQAASRDGNQFGFNAFFAGPQFGGGAVPEDEKENPVAKFLSESQLPEWNRTFANQLRQLDNAGMGMPAINIMPALPAVRVIGEEIQEIEVEEDGDTSDDEDDK